MKYSEYLNLYTSKNNPYSYISRDFQTICICTRKHLGICEYIKGSSNSLLISTRILKPSYTRPYTRMKRSYK